MRDDCDYKYQAWIGEKQILKMINHKTSKDALKPISDQVFIILTIEYLYFLYARLKNGTYYAVAMSVRLSVRPSVRPSAFSGLFFNMLWDINLKLGIYVQ